MSEELKPDLELEIAHVLLIDVVGYTKLLVNEQIALLQELNQIVRSTECFRAAEASGKLHRVPTGDGMALFFFNSPEEPVRCALEISKALQDHLHIQVRMGVHSGPVNRVTDVNDKTNFAGSGINVAQRVLDCGDAGHILLSAHVAEDLSHYRHWQPHLHDLGECEVKHGLRLHLFNLYKDGLGNLQVPEKFKLWRRWRQTPPVRRITTPRWSNFVFVAALLVSVVAMVISFSIFSRRGSRSITQGSAERSAPVAAPEKSIAVLPFENRSEDKANAYFADGIQDEILTRLSKIVDLKVISRTSTQHYKSAPENLREIAKQLGVAHILEGSVQKAGDQVRVNVQLINAQTDSHLWADTYDRKLTDIFDVESDIAKGIAESLQAKLTGHEEQALALKPTNNPEAYDAYLRGLAFEARGTYAYSTSTDLASKATDSYERAVQLDPNFALAWARLSRADALIYFNCQDTTCIARRDAAKRALENAQRLEPNSAETLLALGTFQYLVLHDYGPAKTTLSRVSKSLPGNSDVPKVLGSIARREGYWDESVGYFEQALALDPRNVELLTRAAWTYSMCRRFSTALQLYARALDIMPNDQGVMAAKASIYQAQGNLQEAARLLSEVNAQTPSGESFLIKIGQLRLERNYGEAIRLLQARLAQPRFASEGDNIVVLALMQRLAGDTAAAKVTGEQARNELEQRYRDQQNDAFLAAGLSQALSRVYAVIGEKDSALKAAEHAIMLLPRSKDRVSGPAMEENLAFIQATFGEHSNPVSTLTQLLQIPYNSWVYGPATITPALLRLDPMWDPLRADRAFQKLCEEKQQ